MSYKTLLLIVMAMLCSGIAFTQEQKSEVSIQGTGFFTKDTTSGSIVQQGTQTGGVLAGYRYHFSRRFPAEADYGYARNTQKYSGLPLAFRRTSMRSRGLS